MAILLFLLTLTAVAGTVGCARPAESAAAAAVPVLPSSLSPGPDALDALVSPASGSFPLLDGALTLRIRRNGALAGTVAARYTGVASPSSPRRAVATLEPQIRRTTGVVAGLTDLDVEGSGAFLGEGEFTASLTLVWPASSGPGGHGVVRTKVRGTAVVGCSASSRILMTLKAAGTSAPLGDVELDLQHEIGNTACS